MRLTARARANKENAKLSTGPRSREGKARSSQNAVRHGLSISVGADETLSAPIAALASQIAGANTDEHVYATASRVAEAQIDLRRIASMRVAILSDPTARAKKPNVSELRKKLNAIKRIKNEDLAAELMQEFIEGDDFKDRPQTLEQGIGQLAQKLLRLERYERRAFSRLKAAAREVEALLLERCVNSDKCGTLIREAAVV